MKSAKQPCSACVLTRVAPPALEVTGPTPSRLSAASPADGAQKQAFLSAWPIKQCQHPAGSNREHGRGCPLPGPGSKTQDVLIESQKDRGSSRDLRHVSGEDREEETDWKSSPPPPRPFLTTLSIITDDKRVAGSILGLTWVS